MGVVADIIVFHPYDSGHWGFDCMGGRNPSDAHPYNTTSVLAYIPPLALSVSLSFLCV